MSMAPPDVNCVAGSEVAVEPIGSEAFEDPKPLNAKPTVHQKQEQQTSICCRIPQQREHSVHEVTSCDDLVMQPYKRLSQSSPRPQHPPRFHLETASPPTEVAELSPSLSVSTSSSASTIDLTAPCSGAVTGATSVTGNTTPARSVINMRTLDLRTLPIHKALEMSRLDKLRRSESVDFSDIEQQDQYETTHNDHQDAFSEIPANSLGHVTLQTLDARLMRVSTEDVLAGARLQSPHALVSELERPTSSSSSGESDGESPRSMGQDIEAVFHTGITTPGPDEVQDQGWTTVNNNEGDRTSNHSQKVNMDELLRTSNRLLEDGRRLLRGGERQPRRVIKSMGDVLPDGTSHGRPEAHLRGPSNRKGWYAHDLCE